METDEVLADVLARVKQLAAEVQQLRTLVEHKEAEMLPAEQESSPLSEEQRREMRTMFTTMMCEMCGTAHAKTICPRVREVWYHPNGQRSRVMLWPNSQWAPPTHAITAAQVFDNGMIEEPSGA